MDEIVWKLLGNTWSIAGLERQPEALDVSSLLCY